ncbi:uncharacterized protein LOC142239119 [Haematobia irritans]|uniref:uncharacterized protein LOC142239119 n=1 Tax=Haematobia irritans TaxID=7368 RepID=UPI003F50B20B
MANKTLCNIIAYLSAILSGLGSIFLIFLFCVAAANMDNSDENPEVTEDSTKVTFSGATVGLLGLQALSTMAMFVASVLLIIGIKRDRHTFVSPWVYVVAISVIFNIFKLIRNHDNLGASIVAIVLQIIFWYPIFSFYRELRKGGNSHPAAYNPQSQPMYPQ